MPSLVSLAVELLVQAKKIDTLLEQNGTEYPSFSHDTLETLPEDGKKLRRELEDTSHTIWKLARGGRLSGLDIAFNWTDQLILRIIWQYKLSFAVPLDGFATYDQISAASGLSLSLVARTIRAAIPLNIFDEPRPKEVCHTTISRLLVEDEGYCNIIGLQVEDLGPASARLIETWEKSGGDSGEPGQSAYSLSNGGRSLFTVLSEEPEVASRFNLAMGYRVQDNNFDSFDIVKTFDWQSLDYPGSRLIDLGGGYGHVSQALAQHTQNLEFVVQDLPHVVGEGQNRLPSELKNRVSFEAWDFLQPQRPENPPSAILISRCLHNWSDHYCSSILRALIPALRQGSKILIWDVVLEGTPVKTSSARFNLQEDFIMATISNGKNRSKAEFEQVLKLSDEGFKMEGVRRLDGCELGMIEVTWEADKSG